MIRSPRSLLSLLVAALVLVAGLAACGDDDDAGAGPADDAADEESDAGGEEPEAAFPVTIEHKYGETNIDSQPERVVSVGYTDQDFVLALGVVPVGIRDWYGEQPFGTWSWAQDELGDAEPELLSSTEINFEQVAALDPDLIVGISSGMTEEEWTTLSAIAPTLTQSDEYVDYGVPWPAALETMGRALGKSDEAAALTEEMENRFAEIREAHPEFTGEATMSYVTSATDIGAYSSQDARSRLLTDLGFTIPAEIDELAGDQFYADFSLEEIERIDRDLLVWIGADETVADQIRSHPLHDSLDVVQRGAEIFLTVEQAAAAGFSSPLSLDFLVDEFVPMLEAAMDGDPATEVTPG